MTTRAALYARVSTAGQDPELQLEALRLAAATRDWTVAGEFVDHGISGTRARRPALDQLLAEAHKGHFDLVAVWKFDRFARSTRHLVCALEDFEAQGVDFFSLKDSIDTSTPIGRMMFKCNAAYAEFERDLIRERVVAGVERARRQGKRLGRPPSVRIDRALVEHFMAQGLSTRAIARELGAPETTVRRVVQALRQNPFAGDPAKP